MKPLALPDEVLLLFAQIPRRPRLGFPLFPADDAPAVEQPERIQRPLDVAMVAVLGAAFLDR